MTYVNPRDRMSEAAAKIESGLGTNGVIWGELQTYGDDDVCRQEVTFTREGVRIARMILMIRGQFAPVAPVFLETFDMSDIVNMLDKPVERDLTPAPTPIADIHELWEDSKRTLNALKEELTLIDAEDTKAIAKKQRNIEYVKGRIAAYADMLFD